MQIFKLKTAYVQCILAANKTNNRRFLAYLSTDWK